MDKRPVIIVEGMAEYVALQELCHLDSFLNKCFEVVFEQKEEDVRVLVRYDVLYNHICCAYLVTLYSDIQGCRYFCADLSTTMIVLRLADFVEYGVVGPALFNVVCVAEQFVDAAAIEGEYTHHVRNVKLHEWLEKETRLRLQLNQGQDVLGCFARENTLN